MKLEYQDELLTLIRATKIISKDAFQWQDTLFFSNSSKDTYENNLDPSNKLNHIKMNLDDLFYLIYHCRKPLSFTKKPRIFTKNEIQDFTNQLSTNNFGTGTWEGGWKVIAKDNENNLIVQKNRLMLWVKPTQFSLEEDRGSEKIGMIKIGKEYRYLIQGFYMALGNTYSKKIGKNVKTLRFYWNINYTHSSVLLKLITTEFNTDLIPFKFKVLNDPNKYPRADGAVLYVPKTHYSDTVSALSRINPIIAKHLNPQTPLFAKTLAPGISFAEDPENGESFGRHRSRILAEGLYSAYLKNIISSEAILEELQVYFQKHKIRLYEPFLDFESIDYCQKIECM